jgi:hypothetical protein
MILAVLLAISTCSFAHTYAPAIVTSLRNDVTNLLVFERDCYGIDHLTVIPSSYPGNGFVSNAITTTTINPVRALVLGLTIGLNSSSGLPATEIILFLDSGFASANAAVQWSNIFPPTHHNALAANVQTAWSGDATLQGEIFAFYTE